MLIFSYFCVLIDVASHKILTTSVLVGTILVTLLGGLSLVVRSLRNVDLTLFLDLKRDDKAEKKY